MNWEEILNKIVDGCVNIAWKLALSLVVLLVGNLVIRFVLKCIKKSKGAAKMDAMVLTFILSFLKIGLYLVLAVCIVGILGVETASIITVLATCGAALALALQGSLSNLAGGLMILIFRPFRANDFIEVAGQSGVVTEVGIFYTVMRTADNRQITVPNGSIISSVITNYSREPQRRVDLVLDVAYGTDVEQVKDIVMSIVNKHEQILQDPAPFIRMTEISNSSLKITLRVWCNNGDFWGVKFDLTEQINKAFEANGISIPFPQMDVHIKND